VVYRGGHWVGISCLQWLSCGWMQVSLEEAREKLPELIALVERGEFVTSQFVFSDLLVLQAAPYDPTAPQPSSKHSRSFVSIRGCY
jgi:hypothetical protein